MNYNQYYRFGLTDSQVKKLDEWHREQNALAVEQQRAKFENPSEFVKNCWEHGVPYAGAAGGATTFSFTPTSLGYVVRATSAFTGETIDLTDYDEW